MVGSWLLGLGEDPDGLDPLQPVSQDENCLRHPNQWHAVGEKWGESRLSAPTTFYSHDLPACIGRSRPWIAACRNLGCLRLFPVGIAWWGSVRWHLVAWLVHETTGRGLVNGVAQQPPAHCWRKAYRCSPGVGQWHFRIYKPSGRGLVISQRLHNQGAGLQRVLYHAVSTPEAAFL